MILLRRKGAWNGNKGFELEPKMGPVRWELGNEEACILGLGKAGLSAYLVLSAYHDGKKGLAFMGLGEDLSLIPKKGCQGQTRNKISAQMPMLGWIQ